MRGIEDERAEPDKRLDRANEELNSVLKITSSAFSTLELDNHLNARVVSPIIKKAGVRSMLSVPMLQDGGSGAHE